MIPDDAAPREVGLDYEALACKRGIAVDSDGDAYGAPAHPSVNRQLGNFVRTCLCCSNHNHRGYQSINFACQ